MTPSAVYQGLKTARETKRQESRKGKICLRSYCVSDGRGRNVSGADRSLILWTWQHLPPPHSLLSGCDSTLQCRPSTTARCGWPCASGRRRSPHPSSLARSTAEAGSILLFLTRCALLRRFRRGQHSVESYYSAWLDPGAFHALCIFLTGYFPGCLR